MVSVHNDLTNDIAYFDITIVMRIDRQRELPRNFNGEVWLAFSAANNFYDIIMIGFAVQIFRSLAKKKPLGALTQGVTQATM